MAIAIERAAADRHPSPLLPPRQYPADYSCVPGKVPRANSQLSPLMLAVSSVVTADEAQPAGSASSADDTEAAAHQDKGTKGYRLSRARMRPSAWSRFGKSYRQPFSFQDRRRSPRATSEGVGKDDASRVLQQQTFSRPIAFVGYDRHIYWLRRLRRRRS